MSVGSGEYTISKSEFVRRNIILSEDKHAIGDVFSSANIPALFIVGRCAGFSFSGYRRVLTGSILKISFSGNASSNVLFSGICNA
ncbi:hypothetical protein ANAPH2_01092 [Anaplasma phagocytophilum]|nr:hypothetical protein ANAPH2_01092 [Anaplasma phagocytophilum]